MLWVCPRIKTSNFYSSQLEFCYSIEATRDSLSLSANCLSEVSENMHEFLIRAAPFPFSIKITLQQLLDYEYIRFVCLIFGWKWRILELIIRCSVLFDLLHNIEYYIQ